MTLRSPLPLTIEFKSQAACAFQFMFSLLGLAKVYQCTIAYTVVAYRHVVKTCYNFEL